MRIFCPNCEKEVQNKEAKAVTKELIDNDE